MLMIRPKTINDAALAASNIAETAPSPWLAASTYAQNDLVTASTAAVIANRANTTVTNLGSGVYTVEKTGGVNGTYDASAVSSVGITGDFTLRIKHLVYGTTNAGAGMNSDPLTNDSYTSIDHMYLLVTDGSRNVYESGAAQTSGGDLTYCWIWRTGSTLGYGRGATLAIAQASPDRTVTDSSTLYFDSALAGTGAKFEVALTYSGLAGGAATTVYRSLQAANIANDPASSPSFWQAAHTVYPTWSSAYIYALGDTITDTVGHRLYESLSGGTSATVTMTIASPCVVTWNTHGLAANTPVVFTTTGALPTGLTAGTTYYVLAPTTNSFNVSATAGGAAINTSGTQSGTHTAVANPNLNKAVTDPTFWLDIGPSNKWAMFDTIVGTVTTDASSIDVTMSPGGRNDSLALLNLTNAVSVRVVVSTIADGTLYDMTFDLTSTDGISDWYSWFFEEIERKSSILITDLPNYNNATVRAVITGTGTATLECGNLVVGQSKDLGRTLHDSAQIGITDYSRKDVDDFGNYTIIQRAFSKRGTFKMRIAKAQVDGIQNTLAAYRATPVLYAATADYESSWIYGFSREFNIEIDYPTESLVSVEIEGLT